MSSLLSWNNSPGSARADPDCSAAFRPYPKANPCQHGGWLLLESRSVFFLCPRDADSLLVVGLSEGFLLPTAHSVHWLSLPIPSSWAAQFCWSLLTNINCLVTGFYLGGNAGLEGMYSDGPWPWRRELKKQTDFLCTHKDDTYLDLNIIMYYLLYK